MRREGLVGIEKAGLRLESPQKVSHLGNSSPLVRQLGGSPKKRQATK